jgi:hypothetical protein
MPRRLRHPPLPQDVQGNGPGSGSGRRHGQARQGRTQNIALGRMQIAAQSGCSVAPTAGRAIEFTRRQAEREFEQDGQIGKIESVLGRQGGAVQLVVARRQCVRS